MPAPSSNARVTPAGPPPHLPVIDAFEQAWNASDDAAIGAQLRALNRERVQTWLEGLAEKRGWGDGLPRPSYRPILTHDLDSTQVAARFALADPPGGEWKLTLIQPPRE